MPLPPLCAVCLCIYVWCSLNHVHNQAPPDSFDWLDAWDRMPLEDKEKVATIDAAGLESALHVATSNHR
jgi:hypothetical protein